MNTAHQFKEKRENVAYRRTGKISCKEHALYRTKQIESASEILWTSIRKVNSCAKLAKQPFLPFMGSCPCIPTWLEEKVLWFQDC